MSTLNLIKIDTCKFNGLVNDSFVLACNSVGLCLDLSSDFIEVEIFFILVEFLENTIRLCGGYFKSLNYDWGHAPFSITMVDG